MQSVPPVATRRVHKLIAHGDQRDDPYYWLGDRNDREVIAYLEAENQHVEQAMAHTQTLQEELYGEFTDRIVEQDFSCPVADGDWEYLTREIQGSSYREHYRRNIDDPESSLELILDENVLARNERFFRLRSSGVSPDHQLLAYAVDTTGNERCDIFIRNLETQELLPDVLRDVSGNFVWGSDSATLYYTRVNDAQRPCELYRHRLGQGAERDSLILDEDDDAFYMYVSTTASRRYIRITLSSINTSEIYLLPNDAQNHAPRLIFERRYDVEYEVEDWEDSLFVLTNEDAKNFRLMQTSLERPGKRDWRTVIAHSEDATLTGMAMFKRFIAVGERSGGLPRVRVVSHGTQATFLIDPPGVVQELHIGDNREFLSDTCRLNASAVNLPFSQYDFEFRSKHCLHRKTKPVGGGYEMNDYASEQHFVTSYDGEQIPLYLAYRKGLDRSNPQPVLIYGYGAYGHSYPLYFSSARLSLLDRGVIVAISHLRGGGEMGKRWYDNGKLDTKKNTFRDFSACVRYLLESACTASHLLAVAGGSAGGLVVGNLINEHPELCKAVVAHVPFVDILTTILDDNLPLSVLERDEWGDPNDPQIYAYMKSYAPYDNVKAAHYPAMYVTAGLNDTRVGYWEPAKWVAKIRHVKQDDNALLLRTELHAGHGGKSGRYEALRDLAEEYAFIIDQLLES